MSWAELDPDAPTRATAANASAVIARVMQASVCMRTRWTGTLFRRLLRPLASMRRRRLVTEGARLLQIGMPEMADRLGEHRRLVLGGRDVDNELGGALHDLGDELGKVDRIVVLQVRADELVDLAVQALGHMVSLLAAAALGPGGRCDEHSPDRAA